MKKIFVPYLLIMMMSTAVLGGGSVLAADSESGDTPITAKLTNNTGGPITPPTVTPDPDNKPEIVPPIENNPDKFGIAYYPGALLVEAELQDNGKQDLLLQPKVHVGVKDKTRERNQWNLNASLEWSGANAGDMTGATITGTNGQVQENDGNGALSPVKNDPVTTTANQLSIGNVQTEIMSTDGTKIKNGIYDYSVEDLSLSIPEVSIVSAGEYSGNINWDLVSAP
ncbi:WxL domain-containing protein [Enterococcus faecalis]